MKKVMFSALFVLVISTSFANLPSKPLPEIPVKVLPPTTLEQDVEDIIDGPWATYSLARSANYYDTTSWQDEAEDLSDAFNAFVTKWPNWQSYVNAPEQRSWSEICHVLNFIGAVACWQQCSHKSWRCAEQCERNYHNNMLLCNKIQGTYPD